MINPSFFRRTRYIRAIIIVLPIGISMFVGGIKFVSFNIDNTTKYKGTITETYSRFETVNDKKYETYFINLGDKFYLSTTIVKHQEILKEHLKKGMYVKVWTKNEDYKKHIIQVATKDSIILPYSKKLDYIYGGIMILIGIIVIIFTVVYLIKDPSDIKGGTIEEKIEDKEEMARLEEELYKNKRAPVKTKYDKYIGM